MPDPQDGQLRDEPDTTRDEDGGGNETIPQAVVVGVAAFLGGLAGAALGSGLL